MRVHTLFEAFANADFVTNSFVNYDKTFGIQVDNKEDIPLTINLEAKLDDSIPFCKLLDSAGNQMSITVAAATDAVIVFGDVPDNLHIRVHCDASTALSGTVTIKAIA